MRVVIVRFHKRRCQALDRQKAKILRDFFFDPEQVIPGVFEFSKGMDLLDGAYFLNILRCDTKVTKGGTIP
jgi:hypothetical protein